MKYRIEYSCTMGHEYIVEGLLIDQPRGQTCGIKGCGRKLYTMAVTPATTQERQETR